MKKLLPLILVTIVVLGFAGAMVTRADSEGSITLPPPNNTLKPGPNVSVAGLCVMCHSADYIYTQPPLTKTQWTAEVTKMQKVYGAPIPDADIPLIVDYLMSQNGKQ